LNRFIVSKWPSKDKIAAMIRHLDEVKLVDRKNKYDISIIHAEDDYDIPWILFWHAANATRSSESLLTFEGLEMQKKKQKTPLGAGGWEFEINGKGGVIREEIVKHGLHDRIMSYPVVSLAIARAFHSQD
jgi:abhydrolase domain-containing protein 12